MVEFTLPPIIGYPLLILTGLMFLGIAIYLFTYADNIEKTWQLVNATVEKSSLGSAKDYDDNHRPITLYYANIQYRYAFKGANYSGSSADYSIRSSIKSDAENLVNGHPVGSATAIRVDPANPASSRIVGAAGGDPDLFILGLFAITGIAGILMGLAGMLKPN